MFELTRSRARHLLEYVRGAEVAVVGDVMLDRYFWGTVNRVSPEAPVPVVDVENETFHLGGAANVAANLASLGAKPLLCGIVGDDASGRLLRQIAQDEGLTSEGIITDATRPTTVKTRVIGNNQQIVRLDREDRSNVAADVAQRVLALLSNRPQLKAIILEDYNKGLLSVHCITAIIALARQAGIPVFVDPKKVNFFAFRDAYLVKPNRKEAEEALGRPLRSIRDIEDAGHDLRASLGAENVLITLGAEGMMLVESDGTVSTVPTVAHRVADVSGAGDTVIATIAAMVAAGAPLREAAALANVSAGVVVAEPGIVSITPAALLQAIPDSGMVAEPLVER
ncbi:MAG: D-glycero-beta-D-manno-heptose-7-phosphate kinase [Candidatus Kapabacteria bacterium]|jgi:rfaE bifunctional protein kinase chain/domain|nr:D-glycero-beta-D-manno-heptose-7-phosphate kinase [Candidatus Kapabacteria bacterium]